MARTRLVETGRIICKDDAGTQVTLVELTTMINVTELADYNNNEAPSMKQYLTIHGQHANLLNDGTFLVVSTGTIIRPIN